MTRLAGITLVANGVELAYPFEACIRNLAACCEKVFVVTDVYNYDDTDRKLMQITRELPNVETLATKWDWSISRGRALAYVANFGISIAEEQGFSHVLYVQADEIVDPREIERIELGDFNIALERTYFWKDLSSINVEWTMHLPRLCKLTSDLQVIEDGMSMKIDQTIPLKHLAAWDRMGGARIYHYSRMGDTKKIAQRLNTLDLMFHRPEEFTLLEDYEFGKNNNFESGADCPTIIKYYGTHPDGVKEYYGVS
jgi:hypothetical protein